MDKTIRITSKRMNSEGNLGRSLKVGELAKEVQMAADFKLSNTLCSKLLHQRVVSSIESNTTANMPRFRSYCLNPAHGMVRGLQRD